MNTKVSEHKRFAQLDAHYERICFNYFGKQPLKGPALEALAQRWAMRHYGEYMGFDRNPVMESYQKVFIETYIKEAIAS